ncbi:hypothetical protein C1878_03295 [Gordonibacter sp. 28C]|uniref:hypothetical protein n=1 Tax=Gordonibacter sp. 28C TaxID=2078569 RepID=UPI000DF7387E|nr:hypothetical protein [Gordonibacter sp. 28C]RDB63836.1 hypothetical protein C1878_03295 [Gordonibacter sp. 28C]
MKALAVASAIATFLASLSAAICGAWMHAGGASVADAIEFHTTCAVGTLVFSGITILLVATALRRTHGKDRASQ